MREFWKRGVRKLCKPSDLDKSNSGGGPSSEDERAPSTTPSELFDNESAQYEGSFAASLPDLSVSCVEGIQPAEDNMESFQSPPVGQMGSEADVEAANSKVDDLENGIVLF